MTRRHFCGCGVLYNPGKSRQEGEFGEKVSITYRTVFHDGIPGYYLGEIRGEGEFCYGVFCAEDGFKLYEGEFMGNMPNGHGVRYWKHGGRYEGEVRDLKSHGFGVLYNIDASVRNVGMWRDDKFIE